MVPAVAAILTALLIKTGSEATLSVPSTAEQPRRDLQRNSGVCLAVPRHRLLRRRVNGGAAGQAGRFAILARPQQRHRWQLHLLGQLAKGPAQHGHRGLSDLRQPWRGTV